MQVQTLRDGPERVFAVVFATGEEAVAGLTAFARENGLRGSHVSAIGAFERATLGYFAWEVKDYERIPVEQQMEVTALLGNVALGDGDERKLHLHAVLADRQGRAHGGHLLEGWVRPTLEVVVTDLPEHLQRRHDAQTGLPLLALRGGRT